MPTKMVTVKNTQTSLDNGQRWRLVSEHERGKRWKIFGKGWKTFQNLSILIWCGGMMPGTQKFFIDFLRSIASLAGLKVIEPGCNIIKKSVLRQVIQLLQLVLGRWWEARAGCQSWFEDCLSAEMFSRMVSSWSLPGCPAGRRVCEPLDWRHTWKGF